MERFFFALCVAPFGASACFLYRRISKGDVLEAHATMGVVSGFLSGFVSLCAFGSGFCSVRAARRPSGLDGAGHASAIAALGRMNAPRDLMHLTKSAKCGILTVYF